MARFKLTIEYDGGPYQGWQRQDHASTIQGELEIAAEKINGSPVLVYGSGRTDSGVHALAQIAHLDFDKELRSDCLLYTSPSPRDRTRSRMPSSA